MRILRGLEPAEVFGHFEAICAIPHGSGNTKAISDFVASFGKNVGLKTHQDALGNVIILKPATWGYEKQPPVILQGHLDMVAVKEENCDLDLKRQGLALCVQGERIFAKGTSLGADDGIAVAMLLALLEKKDLPHPPLECVFTVEEETGMDGAKALDVSLLKGKRLINIDSEEEGIFTVGCAGGVRLLLTLEEEKEQLFGDMYRLEIGGLKGGHSGVEIHKNRANAIALAGQLLATLSKEMPLGLCAINGGEADNAIARSLQLTLCLPQKEDKESLLTHCKALEKVWQAAFAEAEDGIWIKVKKIEVTAAPGFSAAFTKGLAAFLEALPQGVVAMSRDMPGLVETSCNLGLINDDDTGLCLQMSLRSSIAAEKEALKQRILKIAEHHQVKVEAHGDYPGWAFDKDSDLLKDMCAVYVDMYGEKPLVSAVHAGLECGFFCEKIPGLKAVSIGPDMENIHTVRESLSIASTARVWQFLCRLLALQTI